jgi:hypothetical protein
MPTLKKFKTRKIRKKKKAEVKNLPNKTAVNCLTVPSVEKMVRRVPDFKPSTPSRHIII